MVRRSLIARAYLIDPPLEALVTPAEIVSEVSGSHIIKAGIWLTRTACTSRWRDIRRAAQHHNEQWRYDHK
jgi:hypothetical protein